MFTDETPGQGSRSVTATPSLATDLSWLLSVAARPSMQTRYPELAEMFNGREDLADRVKNFWDDGCDEIYFTEMQALAHLGGALSETNPDVLWQAIGAAVATVPVDLAMASESAHDLATFHHRFRRLKESPELVQSYLELLQEVWDPIDDMWQQALPVIEEAGRHVVAQYEGGRSLETLIPPGCDTLRDNLPTIVSNVEAGKRLVFVPCLFFGSSLYLEFDDLVVIGTGVGPGGIAARAHTEAVARRLKALADPTRLALLHSLATAPSSVGELATLFRLAQPTVSMHVKVLRQSGLVRSERQGGRLRLRADAAAVETLVGDLRQAVLQGTGASTTGSDLIPATVVESTRSGDPVTA
jgi:DNA-binding transcriptional ArsR family regulator